MKKHAAVVVFCFGLCSCSEGEDEAAEPSTALVGEWSGEWSVSSTGQTVQTEPVALGIQDSLVVNGRIRGEDFTLSDRSVLFDDRQNGVVYDEGDRTFRTNLNLPDGTVWSLGFITDATGDRALIADFWVRVGAIQRNRNASEPPVATDLVGRWSGRYAALDNPNPDDAEIEIGDLTLDCPATLECSVTGDESFTMRFTPAGTSVWSGTVEGLIPEDDRLEVRAVATPDGQMIAVAACASINDFFDIDLFCAYAALSRQN